MQGLGFMEVCLKGQPETAVEVFSPSSGWVRSECWEVGALLRREGHPLK